MRISDGAEGLMMAYLLSFRNPKENLTGRGGKFSVYFFKAMICMCESIADKAVYTVYIGGAGYSSTVKNSS